jgi:hypothetical protein
MIDEEKIFPEARYYWDLEKIYDRFSQVKQEVAPNSRKGLNPTEKLYLRGLLSGYTPTEIARNSQGGRSLFMQNPIQIFQKNY